MSDLKPCPFCGSGVARTVGNAGFSGVELMGAGTDRPFVWCGTCGSAGSSEDSDCKAIAAWNRRAIPAVQPTVSPELLATTHDVGALVDVIRVQTGLIRAGCGGAQHRLNICCDRIDAALTSLKGGAA